MEQIVIDRAKDLGFPCELNEQNCWQIIPIQSEETWKLVQEKSQWILSVRDVPQLRLDTKQAISFLVSKAT